MMRLKPADRPAEDFILYNNQRDRFVNLRILC
jgi:hypothetical protein